MDQRPCPLIVVVDDDAAVRAALEFALELEGFRVRTCDSGEALLLLDLPERDACLVLDERLPGISGLEALAQLRRRGSRLPAVVITSHPGPRLRSAAASAGVPILEKPLMGEGLVNSVRAALAA
jgi:FixJ family two-component response regulator